MSLKESDFRTFKSGFMAGELNAIKDLRRWMKANLPNATSWYVEDLEVMFKVIERRSKNA